METMKMTVAQWADVLSNPRQRDTERHAKKASRGHLKTSSPTQARVFAARLPGGLIVKLDGHTRGLLWSEGKLEQPKVVYVDVIDVKSMDEAKELYTHYDNSGTTENASDRMYGAFRETGLMPESGLLATCGHTSAMKKLEPLGTPIYQIVKRWKRELQLLDAIGAGAGSLNSGMVLGGLCLLRVRGERAVPFIAAVVRDAGDRDASGSDGVDAIVRYVREKKGRTTGEAVIKDVAGRCITACEGWLAGRRFRQVVRVTDYQEYLGRAGK